MQYDIPYLEYSTIVYIVTILKLYYSLQYRLWSAQQTSKQIDRIFSYFAALNVYWHYCYAYAYVGLVYIYARHTYVHTPQSHKRSRGELACLYLYDYSI